MEVVVQTQFDKLSEKLTRDLHEKQKEIRELLDQNVGNQRAELDDAVTKMRMSAADAEARAEDGRANAVKELDRAREREAASVSNRKNTEEMVQDAHRDITSAAVALAAAGAGILPTVERRAGGKMDELNANFKKEIEELREKLNGSVAEIDG